MVEGLRSEHTEVHSGKGQVRVYEFNAGIWTQLGSDIVGEDSFEQAGTSVELSVMGA